VRHSHAATPHRTACLDRHLISGRFEISQGPGFFWSVPDILLEKPPPLPLAGSGSFLLVSSQDFSGAWKTGYLDLAVSLLTETPRPSW